MGLRPHKKVGILITHGTDTMAWTFHFLRYALKNLPCNISITGSQIPLEWLFGGSDAPKNIENSIRLLTYIRGPGIFLVFNDGKVGFDDNIRKINMWDECAFDGNKTFEFMLDYIKHISGTYELIKPRRLDALIHISTGGTIESERADEGYLRPRERPDVVRSYLSKFEGIFFVDLIPRSISQTKDSSNITPEDWKEICEIIEKELRDLGYTTYSDLKFNDRVGIVTPSPLMKTEDYIKIFKMFDGIIISGYGGGNVNILEESEYSVLKAIEWAINNGKYVVLGSQVDIGISEPIYETGWKAIEKGALPAGDFGIPKSQIKLAYILGHEDLIDHVSKKYNIDKRKLISIAFLSGMQFRSLHTKRRIEKLLGLRIPETDPFFNKSFEEAVEELIKFLTLKKAGVVRVKNIDSLIAQIPNLENLKDFVVIIKPDSIIGYNRWGEEIDGAKNIEYIINSAFEWNVITIDFTKVSYSQLKDFLRKNGLSIGEFFRKSKYIFLEGGRPSIYDDSSFKYGFSKKDYMDLLQEIILNRSISSAPATYICLSHQGLVETLRNIIVDIIENKGNFEKELASVNRDAAKEFLDLLESIDKKGRNITVYDDRGNIRARGYRDTYFCVSKNEKIELEIKSLKPYKLPKNIDKDILKEYLITTKLGSGILEDLVDVDKIDVSLIHGDEVNEEAVLFINYTLRKLHEFTKKYYKYILRAENLKNILTRLPIGIEILCSTYYYDEEKPLTQVSGLAVYYFDYNENMLLRDFSYQFHPEILSDMRSFENVYNKEISIKDDGVKLLITTIYSAFTKSWMKI